MTKLTLLIALGLSALSVPAIAQHGPQGGYAPMVGSNDPCLLGTNAQPSACVGPVRIAPVVMSQGPVQLQPAYVPQPAVFQQQPVYQAEQPVYQAQRVVYAQPMMAPAPQQAPVQMSGCVPGYGGPSVSCSGAWVPASGYAPQPMMQPAPQYAPAPVAYAPQYAPASVVYASQYAPQPQQVGAIPTSFFTGGITYGAGFPIDTTYVGGGGGYGYSTGGTRFSGVRERSPTTLVAPPRRERHAPPAHHHGCGC